MYLPDGQVQDIIVPDAGVCVNPPLQETVHDPTPLDEQVEIALAFVMAVVHAGQEVHVPFQM